MKKLLLAGCAVLALTTTAHAYEIVPAFAKLPDQAFACRNRALAHNADYTWAKEVPGDHYATVAIYPAMGKVYWKEPNGKSYWSRVNYAYLQPNQSIGWSGGTFTNGTQPNRFISLQLNNDVSRNTTAFDCQPTVETGIDFEHATQLIPTVGW